MARNKRTARIKKPREVKGKHCVDNLRESCLCQEMLQFPMHCDPFWKGDHAVPSPSLGEVHRFPQCKLEVHF